MFIIFFNPSDFIKDFTLLSFYEYLIVLIIRIGSSMNLSVLYRTFFFIS